MNKNFIKRWRKDKLFLDEIRKENMEMDRNKKIPIFINANSEKELNRKINLLRKEYIVYEAKKCILKSHDGIISAPVVLGDPIPKVTSGEWAKIGVILGGIDIITNIIIYFLMK